MDKKAALEGQDILFTLLGKGDLHKGMSLYDQARSKLEKAGDEQSAELADQVIDKLSTLLNLNTGEQYAFSYLMNGLNAAAKDPGNGLARNMIFKAANSLKMRLPSSMFASVQKLANENPELRPHLVPLLKTAGSVTYEVRVDTDIRSGVVWLWFRYPLPGLSLNLEVLVKRTDQNFKDVIGMAKKVAVGLKGKIQPHPLTPYIELLGNTVWMQTRDPILIKGASDNNIYQTVQNILSGQVRKFYHNYWD